MKYIYFVITNHISNVRKVFFHSGTRYVQALSLCTCVGFKKKIIIIIESLPDLLELARCTSNIEIDANV